MGKLQKCFKRGRVGKKGWGNKNNKREGFLLKGWVPEKRGRGCDPHTNTILSLKWLCDSWRIPVDNRFI